MLVAGMKNTTGASCCAGDDTISASSPLVSNLLHKIFILLVIYRSETPNSRASMYIVYMFKVQALTTKAEWNRVTCGHIQCDSYRYD